MIIGWGSWSIALALLAWGLRFLLHMGGERAVARVIFTPFAIAAAAVYASTLLPGDAWRATHSFGLGGLLGKACSGLFERRFDFGPNRG